MKHMDDPRSALARWVACSNDLHVESSSLGPRSAYNGLHNNITNDIKNNGKVRDLNKSGKYIVCQSR